MRWGLAAAVAVALTFTLSAAGALTPAQGLTVIATRSKLMSRLSGRGAMALLELDAPAAQTLIADYPDVGLAVHASPRQTVIAGPPDQIDAVVAVVAAQARLARRIEVDVASHHRTIDPILPDLRGMLFAYPQPKPLSMWMKNTYIPLDMVFIDGHGRIAQVIEQTTPFSLDTISSKDPALAVLEIAGGEAKRLGIKPGLRVTHPALVVH